MSKNKIPECVNEVQPNYNLPDLTNFINHTDFNPIPPIDEFKKGFINIIKLGTEDYFDNHKEIASTLLLSLISLTENYFRNILTRTVLICPYAQRTASNQNINLGTALWHGSDNLIHGLSENTSFASGGEVKTSSQKFLGFYITKNSLLESILEEYDKICNLRHAIVHSDGYLAGKNATFLSISKIDKKVKVNLDYAAFQEVGALCLTLVTNYNDELFKELCERWALIWRKEFGVNSSNEVEKFQEVWNICFSSLDSEDNVIKDKIDMINCINQIKAIYQL